MGGRIMASIINADTSNGVVITPDTSGEIELQANGVTKAKITANGLQDNNGNSLRGGMYRNLIINGDMKIAQRGTSATGVTSNGYYTVDRWLSVCSPTSGIGTWTDEQSTDVPTGQGFTHSLKRTCTVADASPASTDIAQILQNIEGQNMVALKKGTSNAESATLSFWVKSNKTGTYTVEWRDSNNNRHICASYIISSADTWEKKTITFAGDTVSPFVYDNSSCGNISFNLAAGSAFTSGTLATSWVSRNIANLAVGQTVNLADSTSNYINITGVQLEIGEGASDFEFLPYDVQLQRCQRYYWKQVAVTTARFTTGVQADNTSTGYATVTIPQVLRTTPSVDWSDLVLRYAAANTAISTIIINQSLDNMNAVNLRITGTLTAGQVYQLRSNADTAYLEFSAEL